MTAKKRKHRRKTRIKSVVKAILIFLFAITSSIFFVSLKKKSLMYLERDFYFVSVASSKKSSDLETKSELLKNLGGASVIYNKNGVYYLVANVYLDLSSAEEIKSNLSKYFRETEVLTVKVKAISKKDRKALSQNKQALKFLYDLSFEFSDLQIGFLLGDVSEGNLISNMVKHRLNIEKTKTNLIKDTKHSETIEGFCDLFSTQISNFLSGLTTSKSKQNYVCNFFVSFYINFIEMYECL